MTSFIQNKLRYTIFTFKTIILLNKTYYYILLFVSHDCLVNQLPYFSILVAIFDEFHSQYVHTTHKKTRCRILAENLIKYAQTSAQTQMLQLLMMYPIIIRQMQMRISCSPGSAAAAINYATTKFPSLFAKRMRQHSTQQRTNTHERRQYWHYCQNLCHVLR